MVRGLSSKGRRSMTTLRIGTRGSRLALWQANWVAEQLLEHYPKLDTQVVAIKTTGDERMTGGRFAYETGDAKGLFTGEIEAAWLDDTIDFAVHRLKDLPCELPEGLMIGAYCKREDPRDVLISTGGLTLENLPPGSQLGTSSLRRKAQILALRPDLQCVDIKGNLDTRLRKLEESSELSGLVVAAAGMIRTGWQNKISQYLDEDSFLPAAGQGVIAVEVSTENIEVRELVVCVNHELSEYEVRAERSFLHTLQAGCHAPVGVRAVYTESTRTLVLKAMVASDDGSYVKQVTAEGVNPELVGKQAAEDVIETKRRDDAAFARKKTII